MTGTDVAAALAAAGVGPHTLTPGEAASLDQDGYVVLEGLLSARQVTDVRDAVERYVPAARADGTWRTGGTLHLDDVMDAGPAIDRAWASARVLAAAAHVLGGDLQVGRVHYRAPRPGFGAQCLHSEGGAVALVALVDFTADNGATRVLPGTHRLHGRLPVPTSPDVRHPQEVVLACPAGSAIVLDGRLWHSGRRNRSQHVRHALQVTYRRHDRSPSVTVPPLGNETVDRLAPLLALVL